MSSHGPRSAVVTEHEDPEIGPLHEESHAHHKLIVARAARFGRSVSKESSWGIGNYWNGAHSSPDSSRNSVGRSDSYKGETCKSAPYGVLRK